MTTSMNCNTVRDLLFELRQGRVDVDQQQVFHEHIHSCSACRDHVAKLDSMLDEAMLWEPARAPFDRNALFDAIIAAVTDSQSPPQSPTGPQPSSGDDVFEPAPPAASIPWRRALFAAAALLIASLAWLFLTSDDPLPAAPTVATVDAEPLPDIAAPPASPDFIHSDAVAISDALRVLPDHNARWSIETVDGGWELVATSGQILVEFLPRGDESLSFRFPGGRGQVLGTIFYIDTDRFEVGVVTGRITMTPDGAEAIPIEERRMWRDQKIQPIDPLRWEAMTAAVDPQEHRQKLASLQPATVEAPSPPPTAEPARVQQAPAARKPGPANLRIKAEKALRDRDFHQATQHYEALLNILPSQDRSAGSLRLDLARIYHRHLDDRDRTLEHLRYFVDTWPTDTVTPQAVAEICRLVDEPNKEPHCRRQ